MSLSDDIKDNQIVLFVISKSNYVEIIRNIIQVIAKITKNICYVTINRPYNNVIMQLEKESFKTEGFFFIDAITSTVQTPPEVKNCTFVAAPDALTDLSLALSQALNNSDIVLFDTMSTLAIYQDVG